MLFKDKYNFLGNFFICPFELEIDGKVCKFTNVEAAYQAQKNPEIADKFSQVKGLEAKRMDDKLKITKENWPEYHLKAMANALHAKFQNKILFIQLKAISEDIIHDNYWGDEYWGVYKGKGLNILGEMLMIIRDTNNNLDALYLYADKKLKQIPKESRIY